MKTIDLGSDEPLSGFLSRLAASRGVRLWDLRIHGGILARYNKKPYYYDRVSEVTGLAPAILKRHDLVKVGGTFNAFEMTFDLNDIWAKSARGCPCCIKEDIERGTGRMEARPRLRFGWMLRTIGRCAIHGEPLIVIGPDYDKFSYGDFAGTVSRYSRGAVAGVARAGVGVDTGRSPSLPLTVGAELASDLYFQSRLQHQAAAGKKFPHGTPKLHMLNEMPVPAALLFTEVIGGMQLFGDRYWRRGATAEGRQAAVTAGFEVTRRGYDGLRQFLNERDAIHWRTSRRGHFKKLYGKLQEFLSSRNGVEAYEDVIKFVAEHAHSKHTLGPENAFLGTTLPRRLHSVRTAEVAYGIHRNTLRSILDSAGLLPAGSVSRSDGRIVIAAEVFDKLIADWRARLPVEHAKARLRISRAAVGGLLSQALVVESDHRNKGPRRLSSASYNEFLKQLDRLPRGVPDPSMKNLTDVTRIVQRTYGQIISLILGGALTKAVIYDARLGGDHWLSGTAGGDGSDDTQDALRDGALQSGDLGFDRIFVDPLEVKQALHAVSPPGISFEAAERMLGTTTRTVKRLAAMGHLKTLVADNPMTRKPQTYVSQLGLEEFRETYVSLFEYAKGRGQIARVKEQLSAAGIMPIFHEPGTATFYKRDELPRV